MDKSKRLAIMTWYSYMNYGTALQAVALYHTSRRMGYSADIVSYLPDLRGKSMVDESLYTKLIKKIKEMLSGKKTAYGSAEKKEKFNTFIHENVTFTEACATASELFMLNELYDLFLCGSDQIWSPQCFDPRYYLDFVSDERHMIAYAPSFGHENIDNATLSQTITGLLVRFKKLSVREETGQEIIKKLTGKQATVVEDPTLLLSDTEWSQYEKPLETILNDDFAICYFLGKDQGNYRKAKRIADQKKIRLLYIPVFHSDFKHETVIKEPIGPGEFLWLLHHARYVFTDSLHGTLFSIIFNRQFYVFERFSRRDKDSQNTRIDCLLTRYGLGSRLVKRGQKLQITDAAWIDYTRISKLAEERKQASLAYLDTSLNMPQKPVSQKWEITNTCIGCGACAQVCENGAITIILNSDGYSEAKVDQNKCIRCGKCRTVCPFYGSQSHNGIENAALYAMKSIDEKILEKSSSGGAAFLIGEYAASIGCCMGGCIYDEASRKAKHVMAEIDNAGLRKEFRGSKYLQSDITGILEWIRDNAEKKALVVGTPCQIAAIRKLFPEKNGLILVDLICHGVPSQILWESYLEWLHQKHRTGKSPSVVFRGKSRDWHSRIIEIGTDRYVYKGHENRDPFYRIYKQGLTANDACFECRYRVSSYADIRLGDYWGDTYKSDKSGVSMALAVTQKGKEIIAALVNEGNCALSEHPITEYWKSQNPINPPLFYEKDEVLKLLKSGNISKVLTDYYKPREQMKRIYKMMGFMKSFIIR